MFFKKIINTLLLLVIFVMPIFAFAQADESVEVSEFSTLANITISDAQILSNKDNVLTLSFALKNFDSKPFSDIKYGAELVMVDGEGNQTMVDSLILSDTDFIKPEGEIQKNITYPISGVAPGKYEVWITARTTGGMILGLANAGVAEIQQSDAASFLIETCYLTIDSEAGAGSARYDLTQGVDVSIDENINLTCAVKNYSQSERMVVPDFATYRRTVFGDSVITEKTTVSPIKLLPGENTLTLTLPKAIIPQAYEVMVVLEDVDSGKEVSNKLLAHYVLRGASATIQSVNFDKVRYSAGEAMNFSMYWTGPADRFYDSRGSSTALVDNVTATISVVSENNQACIDDVKKTVLPGNVQITAVAKNDCINPKATITLGDERGNILDKRNIEVVIFDTATNDISPSESTNETVSQVDESPKYNTYMIIVFLGLLLALLTVLLAFFKFKKVDVTNLSKVLVFCTVLSGYMFVGLTEVEAVTWTHRWSNSEGWHNHTVTVNANKSSYLPGETISLSSMIKNADCTNNSIPIHRLTSTFQGVTKTMSENPTANTVGNKKGSSSYTAPTTPGTYTIDLQMKTLNRNEISTNSITITVLDPAAVGNFDSVSTGSCSVTGWAYDPISTEQSINVHVYRDGASGSGGTYVTSCSANIYRSDVNATYGISGNHGFNCSLPASYIGTGNHNLYIHAIDTSDSPNNVIGASPRSLSCPAPSATISAVGCTISAGQSTCSGSVTWTIANATSPNVYNNTAGTQFSANASGSNSAITLNNGITVLQARDSSTVLNSVNAVAACASGSTWNGSLCELDGPIGTITGTSCSIAEGQGSCTGSLTWTILNSSSPNVRNNTAGTQFSANASGSNSPITLNHGTTVLQARDGSTVLNSTNLVTSCVSGLMWYAPLSQCITPPPPAPVINLALSKDVVRSGSTVNLLSGITAAYPTECTVTGLTDSPIIFTHSGTPITAVYTSTSKTLSSAQVVTVTCEPNPAIVGLSEITAETRVDVVPVMEEI